jgi:hypothetical protein
MGSSEYKAMNESCNKLRTSLIGNIGCCHIVPARHITNAKLLHYPIKKLALIPSLRPVTIRYFLKLPKLPMMLRVALFENLYQVSVLEQGYA